MEKARELLEKTDMTVNKISVAVGYSSTRSFFAAFKSTYGMTPSQYRKNNS
jgi:AraC-like DNA-binding protein